MGRGPRGGLRPCQSRLVQTEIETIAMTAAAREADPNGLQTCWSCKGPVVSAAMFCATCGAVQPPGQGDHFTRLGLTRDFDVDKGDLDQRYFALQRDLHPDRFATRSAREREISLQQSTSLNQAYETVKSPLVRAEYLLSLNGVTVNAETGNRPADPNVLMEAMESREALAEAGTEAEVTALAARARESHAQCLGALTAAFRADDMDAAARLATRLKYLAKFAEEARGRARAARAS